ncbi:MAG: ATP-binding cassette domain-containing protein [Saprospiraceae bacterium]|nr:ATP-binding cassette domain-containing protein [Saprospiraceae bacterium]
MVTVEGLTKWYGSQCAVDHINFTARPGEILGFLGPNGAGKSTTMKMMTSYIGQDEGKVNVCGFDTRENALESRSRIGYLPEHNPLYKDMYVKEFLGFAAGIHHVPNATNRIAEVIGLTGLGKEQHKPINALSKGYRQRVGLAQAMLHNPEVLILDEPTSGLDMNQLADIRALIRELGKEKTVILSTHIMQEVQALCDRVIIINEGKLVADDPIGELQNRIKGEHLITVKFLNTSFQLSELKSINGVERAEAKEGEVKIYADAGTDVRPDIFRLCAAKGWVIIEMVQEKLSVEYIFQKLTNNKHD